MSSANNTSRALVIPSRLHLALAAVLVASFNSTSLFAQSNGCAMQAPKPVQLDVVQPEFRKHFCIGMKSTRCDSRWNNISPLISKLATDSRVPTVGTAAYILATTFVETGILDFNPSAVERMPSDGEKPKYYPWIGRGWVQLTYYDKYQSVAPQLKALDQFKGEDVDILKSPKLAQRPDISYEILVLGMTQGLLENYRRTAGGGCDNAGKCSPPIKLSDFVNSSKVDYAHARAVINANCVNPKSPSQQKRSGQKQPCADILYEGKGYIPDSNRIDAADEAAGQARQFEAMLCKGMGISQ
jgi:hypothetical protein